MISSNIFGGDLGDQFDTFNFRVGGQQSRLSIWPHLYLQTGLSLKWEVEYKVLRKQLFFKKIKDDSWYNLKVWRKVGPHWNKQRALMRQTKSPQWDKQRAITMELDIRTGLFVCLFTNKNQFLGWFLWWGLFVCLTEGSLFVSMRANLTPHL